MNPERGLFSKHAKSEPIHSYASALRMLSWRSSLLVAWACLFGFGAAFAGPKGPLKILYEIKIKTSDVSRITARPVFSVIRSDYYSASHYVAQPQLEVTYQDINGQRQTKTLGAFYDKFKYTWFCGYSLTLVNGGELDTERINKAFGVQPFGVRLEGEDVIGKSKTSAEWWNADLQIKIDALPKLQVVRSSGNVTTLGLELVVKRENFNVRVGGQPVEFEIRNNDYGSVVSHGRGKPGGGKDLYNKHEKLSGYAWVVDMNTVGQTAARSSVIPANPAVSPMTTPRPPPPTEVKRTLTFWAQGFVVESEWTKGMVHFTWSDNQPSRTSIKRDPAQQAWRTAVPVSWRTPSVRSIKVVLENGAGGERQYTVEHQVGRPVIDWNPGPNRPSVDLVLVRPNSPKTWTINVYHTERLSSLANVDIKITYQLAGQSKTVNAQTSSNGGAVLTGVEPSPGSAVVFEVPAYGFQESVSLAELTRANFSRTLTVKGEAMTSTPPVTPIPPAMSRQLTLEVRGVNGKPPVVGAEVFVDGKRRGTTGADGKIVLPPESVTTQSRKVEVKHQEYLFEPIYVGPQDSARIISASKSLFRRVRLHLKDQDGNPLVGRNVTLHRTSGYQPVSGIGFIDIPEKVKVADENRLTLAALSISVLPVHMPLGFKGIEQPQLRSAAGEFLEYDLKLSTAPVNWTVKLLWHDGTRFQPVPSGNVSVQGAPDAPIRNGVATVSLPKVPDISGITAPGFQPWTKVSPAPEQKTITIDNLVAIEETVRIQAVDKDDPQKPVPGLRVTKDGRNVAVVNGNTCDFTYFKVKPFQTLTFTAPNYDEETVSYAQYERMGATGYKLPMISRFTPHVFWYRLVDAVTEQRVPASASAFTFFDSGRRLSGNEAVARARGNDWEVSYLVMRNQTPKLSVEVKLAGYLTDTYSLLPTETTLKLLNDKRSLMILLNDASGWADAQRARADVRQFLQDSGRALVEQGVQLSFGSTDLSQEPTHLRREADWTRLRQRLHSANALVASRLRPENLVEMYNKFGKSLAEMKAGVSRLVIIAPRQNSPPPGVSTAWVGVLREKLRTNNLQLVFVEVDSISTTKNSLLKDLCGDNYHKVSPGKLLGQLKLIASQ